MRNKKSVLIALSFFVFISVVCSLNFINAEIMLSQPNTAYNLGDTLNFEVKIDTVKTGYMDVNLNCNGVSENLYHNVPDSTVISVNRKLTPDYINMLYGNCYFLTTYSNEEKRSQNFEISKEITIDISASNLSYTAGETMNIKGAAYKKNGVVVGQVIPAFVEIFINDNLTITDTITNGQFDTYFLIPENLRKGTYALVVRVYDKDGDNILNIGEITRTLTVKQIPARIEIALDKDSMNPGEDINFIPFLYDKAGDLQNSKITLKLKNSNGDTLYEGYVTANEQSTIKTETTYTQGYSTITASIENIMTEKTFKVNELKKVSAEIKNDTLVITNIGNVAYMGLISIKIGGQNVLKEVDIPLGGQKIFWLQAPDGSYDVAVKDSSDLLNQNVLLTGSAIDASDVRTGTSGLFEKYIIVWAFIVIILAIAVYVLFKKYQSSRYYPKSHGGLTKERYSQEVKKGGVGVVKPEFVNKNVERLMMDREITRAEQVMVMHGQKSNVGVIALKAKNNISGIGIENFKKAIMQGYKAKGVSYTSGDYTLIIFSPIITKNYKNEETAVKVALDIDNFLKDHNRKFRNDKIVYGIGVNSGEIINRIEGQVLQFTSISKTLNIAKRIAEISNEQVLLSKDVHEKTPGVKAEKFATGAMEVFTVKRVVDHEASSKFIGEFLRRNTAK